MDSTVVDSLRTAAPAASDAWLLGGFIVVLVVVAIVVFVSILRDGAQKPAPVRTGNSLDDGVRSLWSDGRSGTDPDQERTRLRRWEPQPPPQRKRLLDPEICDVITAVLAERRAEGLDYARLRSAVQGRTPVSKDRFARHLDHLLRTGAVRRVGRGGSHIRLVH